MLIFYLLLLQLYIVKCILPPPFEVKFQDNDSFLISADFSEDDEEMIKQQDITSLHLDIENGKLDRLHRQKRNGRFVKPIFAKPEDPSLMIWYSFMIIYSFNI